MKPAWTFTYAVFFLSGVAALMYEVLWVRSLSLVFGGTHLAVTTVLSVYMAGLALGSHLIGKRVDAIKRPLRYYGGLELAIGLFAVIFLLLMRIYPDIYVFIVQGRETSRFYLSGVRVLFAFFALIVPTTLMGGTLPVMTRVVSGRAGRLSSHLSFLYGFNTLGAVAGTLLTGFVLLRFYSVSTTFHLAILINCCAGLTSILLPSRWFDADTGRPASSTAPDGARVSAALSEAPARQENFHRSIARLALVGIGVSGFCALGYEILWTRILTLTIGTSVYGFTIMLAAFLTGIALGSQVHGIGLKRLRPGAATLNRQVRLFGIVQLMIGLGALAVTIYIRDLPVHSIALHNFFIHRGLGVFNARQWGNLTLAFTYMLGPAFLMGLAFPVAGKINAEGTRRIGHAVGSVMASNTVGAILGSAVSGYVMIYVFGIERSLQLLVVVNIGLGALLLLSIRHNKMADWSVVVLTLAALAVLITQPHRFTIWDAKYFAIFQNNQPSAYDTPERKKDAIDNTQVLFYHEGVDSTISSIKIKGADQAVLVNGKVVASSALKDRQCQLTLGHLPMLMHSNPRKVLVVGLGTGMTLGAVSVHPGIEDLTLVEIEPNVLGAARTFGAYNNHVLDNPSLKIVYNDGRNFLMTTQSAYDVITADPIHPWTQGSGYLYTAEYFKIASEHLLPGGIMCQWLPIYELSVADLKSVVKTFAQNFKYTMAWLTQYDAELIGSNAPLLIDEGRLHQRLSDPAVHRDLQAVMMGTVEDFLSYFIMGTDAMTAFSRDGIVNTDDNLYLEFSTPASLERNVMQANIEALSHYRASILPYLAPARSPADRAAQKTRWTSVRQAASVTDRAHALFLGGQDDSPEFQMLLARLRNDYPWFSPAKFLDQEYRQVVSMIPRLLRQSLFELLDDQGQRIRREISAVMARAGPQRAAAVFVDNAAKVIFGQRYFSGPDLERSISEFSSTVMQSLQAVYDRQARLARAQGRPFPAARETMRQMKLTIAGMAHD